MHFDVIPVMQRSGESFCRGDIGRMEAFHRLVTEYDPPAKCVIRLIPLDENDVRVGIAATREQCGVEAARPAANDQEPLDGRRQRAISCPR
jgi:hypothetical protein